MRFHEPEFVTTNGKERGPNDYCIVSCGIGPEYQEGLYSTRLHCEVNVPEAWRLFYRDYPKDCPTHQVSMYAFKIYAMRRAIAAGFRFVLWMDATFQPVRPIDKLWDIVKDRGWYVPLQGDAKLGNWVTDDFLAVHQTTREALMQVPLVYSGLVGLDMNNPDARKIWEAWFASWSTGIWNGPHRNDSHARPGAELKAWGLKFSGYASDDPRCEGHRHDESALSYVLHSLGHVPQRDGILTRETAGGCIADHVPLVIPNRWGWGAPRPSALDPINFGVPNANV